jgi:hypothetical protein
MGGWRRGPAGADDAPAEYAEAEHVALEVPQEGPPAEPAERKKVSSVLFIRSAIMVSFFDITRSLSARV